MTTNDINEIIKRFDLEFIKDSWIDAICIKEHIKIDTFKAFKKCRIIYWNSNTFIAVEPGDDFENFGIYTDDEIKEYFVTPNEYRKMKLNKLSEISESS